MAKVLFISWKSSDFNNRAQSQSYEEARLPWARGRGRPAQGGQIWAPSLEEAAEGVPWGSEREVLLKEMPRQSF